MEDDYFMITVRHRLLTLTHTMLIAYLEYKNDLYQYACMHATFLRTFQNFPQKSYVALLVVVAAVAVNGAVNSVDSDAIIVKQNSDVFPEQYAYQYETSNGIQAQESGVLKNAGQENAALEVQGTNAFTAPDGKNYVVTYIANEFGYQPQGDHLPVAPSPPPVPDYIIRSIEYIKTHAPKVPVVPSRK
ncbi:unnamed protein product [Euphydryas editha]|uniref:Larval cuticle protein LCP-17 n=1 Tax=Euphydryas editha TaxID=104508 RepID=A0AAU9UBC9_EUPED|nr:unnamed protein product [Euphydryas editha]